MFLKGLLVSSAYNFVFLFICLKDFPTIVCMPCSGKLDLHSEVLTGLQRIFCFSSLKIMISIKILFIPPSGYDKKALSKMVLHKLKFLRLWIHLISSGISFQNWPRTLSPALRHLFFDIISCIELEEHK